MLVPTSDFLLLVLKKIILDVCVSALGPQTVIGKKHTDWSKERKSEDEDEDEDVAEDE